MLGQAQIDQFRKETDGTSKVIHLNNAGSSLPPNIVRDTMIDYLAEEMTYGGYETHTKHFSEIEGVYDSVAQLIDCNRSEVAIVENATVAWNAGFQAIDWNNGDVILATMADYASNYLSYLHLKRKVDIEIAVIPNDESGQPDVNALKQMMSDRVRLVSVTHMPTNSGLVANAEAIGEVVKGHRALYLLDACQSAGQYPLNVEAIGCDLLSATGRKYLRGPRGTGFLYVGEQALNSLTPYWVDLHSAEWTGANEYKIRQDARKFENWEGNRAGVLGLKTAVDYALNIGLADIWERVQMLGNYLREQLVQIDSVQVNDIGEVLSGIVSFNFKGKSGEELKKALLARDINVSWNGLSNTYLDMSDRGLSEITRASVHYYNTTQEIDQFIEALREME